MAVTVDVVCLGETMALVAPDPPLPLTRAEHLVLSSAGAESNVAISLARLGTRVQWCSRLGDDPLGHRVLADIAAAGVDTDLVRFSTSARTGVLIKSPGDAATTVLYYRAGSAASTMDETDVERALAGRPRVLHLSGITQALSVSCARAIDTAISRAGDAGVTVSFDVNHRAGLWADVATAARDLRETAQRCDVVFVGLDEAAALWHVSTATDVRAVLDEARVLIVKDGARAVTGFDGRQQVEVDALPVEVLEPVGAGDAFAAGWLHAYLLGLAPVEALRLGHLVAATSLVSAIDHAPLPNAGALVAAAGAASPWPPAPPQG